MPARKKKEEISSGVEITTIEEKKPKRKGGTKAKKDVTVVASISADGEINGTLQPLIKRPLIAHLPINSVAVIFSDDPPKYNPEPPKNPEAYNSFTDNPFADTEEVFVSSNGLQNCDVNDEISKQLNDDIARTREEMRCLLKPDVFIEIDNNCNDHKSSLTILQQQQLHTKKEKKEIISVNPYHTEIPLFAEYAENEGKVPEQVQTACFWCCHGFHWKPVVVPCRYENVSDKAEQGIYKVYGNFCTPECAMAYLLNEQVDMNSRWERISWLHHIYCIEQMKRIYPAPGRETLKMFGGPYEIDEFRGLCLSHKLRVDINYPPMASLLATMDTKPIDFYESVNKNSERVHDSGLRLKRSKPLKEIENTLDACFKLQIK
jgi:hypothetical protein